VNNTEISGSIKDEKFPDQLSDSQLPRKSLFGIISAALVMKG
jgi:hypothetical protein